MGTLRNMSKCVFKIEFAIYYLLFRGKINVCEILKIISVFEVHQGSNDMIQKPSSKRMKTKTKNDVRWVTVIDENPFIISGHFRFVSFGTPWH